MKHSIVFTLAFFVSMSSLAAPMVRVVSVIDSRTIVVDRAAVAAQVRLADIVMSPSDEPAAVAYLQRILVGSWVLVEPNTRGEAYVYRSPDGLCVNSALARRAYFDASTKMIYLGEASPGPLRAVKPTATTESAQMILPPPKPQRARTTPKGAHRIPRSPK